MSKLIVQIAIPSSSLFFLNELKENNNRDWFNYYKSRFLEEQANIESFADALLAELSKIDLIETPSGEKSLHRIYRDTRFSSNKTPYKTNWSGSFKRATKQRRGSYYFHIEPGNSFIAGGFWGPNAQDLKRIRDEIAFDANPFKKILKSKTFIATFGTLQGDKLKTAPKGFEAANEAIDLLRFKQFIVMKKFTDEEVLNMSFLKEASSTFNNMRPFFDYMSEILSTDINGIDIN